MITYIDQFNELAKLQGSKYGLTDAKLWDEVDPKSSSQADYAEQLARGIIKTLYETPIDLVGKCFNISTAISTELCKAGIKHIFTVGDVKFNGTSYYNVTRDSLHQSFSLGFDEAKTLDAHAWITLSCGTVIDATILPSIAYRKFGKHLKFIQSLYRSDLPSKYPIAHQPLFLGPMFGIRTNFERSEMSMMVAMRWIEAIEILLNDEMPSKK